MQMQVFQQVVTLGPNCRPKVQSQRVFGKQTSRRHIFDWQITPAPAVLEYLRNDFSGMFELDDLIIKAEIVRNARYDTRHPHEFPKGLTNQDLRDCYLKARAAHDRWCAATRKALDNSRSTLFVLGAAMADDELAEMAALIAARCPQKHYLILDGPVGDHVGIGEGDYWMGDHDIWSKHLSRFEIRAALPARMSYQLHRLRSNFRYLLPPPWRRKNRYPSFH